ncbi:MAG: putative secreted protein [Myxococcaceae bacterium]|nr:putative secreted protein [Myxococcaceae bacterium]
MREVRWSRLALIALAACGSDEKLTGDGLDQSQDHASVSDAGKASGGKTDGGTSSGGGKADGGASSGGKADGGKDAGSTTDPTNCGKSGFSTGAVIPDMLIVLDRSGSMKQEAGGNIGLNCSGTPDFITAGACSLAGIDCKSAMWAMTTSCGGTQTPGAVNRWDPSVKAIESLTTMFDSTVSFGLMTFPKENARQCGPGEMKVPIGLGTAGQIAAVLDKMQPGGNTPTGQTLELALQSFQGAGIGADTVVPTRYVLLVTDGQPTCPGGNNALQADIQYTLDAIDKLRDEGIKTFVVGYDAALDQQFSDALTQFAQHGGTDKYYPVQNEDSLSMAFQSISQKVVTCRFEFKNDIGNVDYLHVTLDGKTLRPNDPNGWALEGKTITVQGDSCATLQGGQGHRVEIVLECEPVLYQ